MTWFRLPLFVWSMYATSLIMVLGTPVLAITLAAGRRRAALPRRHLRPAPGRRPDPVPAPVLVLLAPGGLHHDPAGDGRGQRDRRRFSPQADLRLQVRRLRERGDRGPRLPGLGPPHVRRRQVDVRGAGLLDPQLPRRDPLGDQGLQLDGDAVQGLDLVADADALRARLHRPVHDRRPDRPVPRGARPRRARARHLLRRRALPLHHGRRRGDGLPRRAALLVAEDDRADVPRVPGEDQRARSSSSAST